MATADNTKKSTTTRKPAAKKTAAKSAPEEETETTQTTEDETSKSAIAEREADAAAKKAEEEAAASTEEEVDAEIVNEDDEEEDPIEVLEPMAEPRQWTIGKTPEHGGSEDSYSVYTQRPLGYFQRMQFFAYVSRTVADAIKAGGSVNINGTDLLSSEGTVRERAAALVESDFGDVASFMALAMQLIGYADDFLLECYCMWLDVPAAEKGWAKKVMRQPWDPENKKWGITDEQGEEIIAVFIDQNYKDTRRFFVETLPRLGKRIRNQESLLSKNKKSKKSVGRGSAQDQ